MSLNETIILADDTDATLRQYLKEENLTPCMVLTDTHVVEACMPRLSTLSGARAIVIGAGEAHKTVATLTEVWRALHEAQATRSSLLVNVGGGMVTDLGGMAAATFKRGLPCLNVATTLLGAVDASIGGKTAVNFCGVKNEIGVFSEPKATIIGLDMLSTLPYHEVLSGYGEMLKTAYIADGEMLVRLLRADALEMAAPGLSLRDDISRCIEIKSEVVSQDPTERGWRKVLNFGHTAGHAFESLSHKKRGAEPLAHGVAVAYGILVALVLSRMKCGMVSAEISRFAQWLRTYCPALSVDCSDYDTLLALMHSDKKNLNSSEIRFTLLKQIAVPAIDVVVTDDEVRSALDIARDYL